MAVMDSTRWLVMPWGYAVLEEFVACWEGLEDPRNGNAALHDFHELLMIALCAVLSGGQGAPQWRNRRRGASISIRHVAPVLFSITAACP